MVGHPEAAELPRVRWSLRLKLLALAALVAVLAGGVPASFLILRGRSAERQRIRAQIKQLGSTIASGGLFAEGTGGVDARALRAFVENAPSLRLPLAYVLLVDPDGTANLEKSAVSPAVLREIDHALADTWNAGGRAEVLEQLAGDQSVGQSHQWLWVNIQGKGGEPIGRLRIGMSTRLADQRARVAFIQSGAIVGGVLALALLVAVLVSGGMVRPLRRLTDAMGGVADGDLQQEVLDVRSSDEVGRLSAAFNVMTAGLRQRERLRSTLGRFVSDQVAEHLMEGADDLELSGETRRVTVLFLDMRDFSAMAETQTAGTVFELLNGYFGIVVESVERHGGVINKFIGDAIMAVWGAPKAVSEPEMGAILAAWDIQSRIGAYNWERHQQGKVVLNVGIGINTGPAVAGNVGAASRMEYTVIGHTVNMAQRYESVAGPGQVLLSPETYATVRERVEARMLPSTRVKGRRDPVTLYELTKVPEMAAAG